MRIPDDIHIRELTWDMGEAARWGSYLTAEEVERRALMKAESRQRSFLLGRAAARSLLGELTNRDPGQVDLRVMNDGRVVAPGTPFHLSLSHSGDRAVAAVSRRRIGVDIEQIVEKPGSLLRFVLHEDEVPHVSGLPISGNDTLFLCWTIKESVLKAIGTGLMRSPKSVRLNVDYERNRATVSEEDGTRWDVQFEMQGAYMFALAFEPDRREVSG